MSETLRDLVVSLSLQTDNFTRNIKSVNKQIQEAESKFRLAAAGIEGFEKTATGLSTQLSTLERRLQLQRDAVTQYEKALTAAQGVGKKLAQRIILELKDKLGAVPTDTSSDTFVPLQYNSYKPSPQMLITPFCACASVSVKLRLNKGEAISDAASIHWAPFQSVRYSTPVKKEHIGLFTIFPSMLACTCQK